MRLLVIGGTVFLGQAFVREAAARGWEVTTFNRGESGVDEPGVTVVRGDRERPEDLAGLAAHGPWDAVVDVCGYTPRVVGASVAALAGSADSYLYISSINAYPGFPAVPVDETSPRHECAPDAGTEDGDYGTLKVGCERAVTEGFPGRALVIQPGLIMGPGDRARRLAWWLERAARGGRMLAPGSPDRVMQLIDSRDIAAFGLDRIVAGDAGTYLTGGPGPNTTWGEYLGTCVEATGGKATLEWVDDDRFLLDQKVDPWMELPLWSPLSEDFAAVWQHSSAKAVAAGLRCRPVTESIRDTAEWLFAPGGLEEANAPHHAPSEGRGLAPDKEQAILAAWAARPTPDRPHA
ncbi:NAD-dependent epimerase/dehydratase family protein [Streptacidiphilus sp. EB129]|uniref:NAD-dependent epimerase/dehydratase family protein n=1 Tax=Streptacidiphilus sp. EB129 TaxID=3156262 RepID=UPI003511EDA0